MKFILFKIMLTMKLFHLFLLISSVIIGIDRYSSIYAYIDPLFNLHIELGFNRPSFLNCFERLDLHI